MYTHTRGPHRGRVLRTAFCGVLLLFLGMQLHAQADIPGELRRLQTRLGRLVTKVSFLGQSLQKINVSGTVPLSKRLTDGQINFLLKDYLRASIVLLDAVENPKNRGRRLWFDAVYVLAESLYRNRNLTGAVKYYRLLVSYGRKHSQKSLVRLMEIASKTQKSSWLNRYFRRAQSLPQGPLRNQIYYLRAKGLYKLQRYTEAQGIFQRIVDTPKYGPRAKYFLAVLLLRSNLQKPDVNGAIALLKGSLRSLPANTRDQKLRDVVLLSLGRLHMEKKLTNAALSYYQKISRKSHIFDQALYEICWAYIRRGTKKKKRIEKQREYNRALRSLDLLLAFLPQSPFYPRAQILKGNIQLQLAPFKKGKAQELLFSQALKSYQKIAQRYRRVYQEMKQLTQNRARPLELFEQLIAQQLDQFNVAKILPQDALRWMSDEELMSRTLLILRDLREMQKQLDSARVIVKRLESALQVRKQYSLSPTLREARLRVSNVQAQLTEIRVKLVQLKSRLIGPKLSASERQEFARIRSRIKNLRYLFLRTPKTRKEMLKRSSLVQLRINKMVNRLHKITILLSYSTRALRSVRRYLETNPDARSLTPSQRSTLETDANQFGRMITTLQKEKAKLSNELSLARIQLGYAAAAPQEVRIQRQYRQAIQQERLFLNRLKSRLSASEQQQLESIQQTSKRLRAQTAKIRGFFVLLARLSNQFARRVQGLIAQEKIKLNSYEQQIFQLKGSSKRLASRIAFNTFLTVRKKFRTLVLQAEVGVIDVAWREKQAIQNEKIRLTKERNRELRVLDSEFRDLVQEVK